MNNYGIPIIGTMDDINSITKEDLQNWYNLYYQPNNAIVIIAGNFDSDQVKRFIQKYYGSITNREKIDNTYEKNDFQTKLSFTVYDKVSKPIVFLSFKKPKFNKDKMRNLYALDLFIEIMDGGYSSRLTKNLINNQKTALDIFISNDTFNQYPNLIVVGGTPRGDISSGEFKTKVLNEFSEQSINKITNDELMNAKARIKANNVYKFDSVFYQAMQVGMMETKGISWENLDNYSSIMESMTLEEVKSAGVIYFSNDNLLTTVLRPKK